MSKFPFVPYEFETLPPEQMSARAHAFYENMDRRRSIRDFSDRAVPQELIELAIQTASTAPSGAHRQPWRFVAVNDPSIKRQIRLAAEAEERDTYDRRMSDEWREALAPLGTNADKPFLETVPWIVVLFEELHGLDEAGQKIKNYYVKESVGLAGGLFIAALHNMGLATLTHTPSPMGFLRDILGRPKNERPFVLFPIGFPAEGAQFPSSVARAWRKSRSGIRNRAKLRSHGSDPRLRSTTQSRSTPEYITPTPIGASLTASAASASTPVRNHVDQANAAHFRSRRMRKSPSRPSRGP